MPEATAPSKMLGFDVSWLDDEQFLFDVVRQLLAAIGCSPQTIAAVDTWAEFERQEQERERALGGARAPGSVRGDGASHVGGPDSVDDLTQHDQLELARALEMARTMSGELLDVGTDVLGRLDALGIRPELVGLDRTSLDDYLVDLTSRMEAPVEGDLPGLPRDAEVPAVRPTRAEKRAIDGVLARMPDDTVRKIAPIGGRWLGRVGYRIGLFVLRRVQRRRGVIWSVPSPRP